MSREITEGELRDGTAEIMRKLDEGETFFVMRYGVPVGELTPLRPHHFVGAEAAVALFRAARAIDSERFRTDLDSVASQDPTPRS